MYIMLTVHVVVVVGGSLGMVVGSQNERAEQLALRGRLAGVAPSRRRCTPCKTRYVGIPGSPGGCPGVSDDAR